MRHPVAGDLELCYDKFSLAGADRQMLVIYQAEPGTRSEEALTFLAAAMASPGAAGPRLAPGARDSSPAGRRP